MRTITGYHFFTFPYFIGDGLIGAEFEARCRYVIDAGVEASRNPPPGDPGSPPEVREITGIEIDAFKRNSEAERAHTKRYFSHAWVPADAHLEALIRAYLASDEGHADLIDSAQRYGVEEGVVA